MSRKEAAVMRRILDEFDDYDWEDDEDYPYIK